MILLYLWFSVVPLWFFISSKYGGSPLFKMRHPTPDMAALPPKYAPAPPKLWQISPDMACCAGFKAVGFVTWYVSQQNTFSYFTVSAVKKLITHQSQISVDLPASKGLFCNICALPAFVSEKEKKRINPPYRTWCDWRCLTFSRTYSRKSKP